ncbi:MAG: AI-2E family transporter [Deltaproteobacteria bacterium]|nr:MAG: AI-2E family transporter [Deltaproteobacteria bacterium]
MEIVPLVGKSAQVVSESIVGQIQSGAKNFLLFVLNYIVALFIFFFFIRDGESLGKAIKDLFPMTAENKEKFFDRLLVTVSAIVRGLVVTAIVQAVLSGVAFALLGVPFAIFFSALIAFLALVPVGGAAFVWFPIALYLGFSGSWVKAIILMVWGGGVISLVDNILRPFLIGDKTKIPTLFLFLSILGGLSYYGVIGVFLGPIFLSLFIALVEIYRKEYSSQTLLE